MAYFKNYYSTLKDLKDTVLSDVKGLSEDEKKDNRLVVSLINFAKEVGQLTLVAANNSAIENKASAAPETESSDNNG